MAVGINKMATSVRVIENAITGPNETVPEGESMKNVPGQNSKPTDFAQGEAFMAMASDCVVSGALTATRSVVYVTSMAHFNSERGRGNALAMEQQKITTVCHPMAKEASKKD